MQIFRQSCKLLRAIFVGFCFSFLCLSVCPQKSYALEPGDITIRVSPSDQRVNLSPASSTTGSIIVKNVGRQSFNFKVFARPYQVLNENYDPDFNTDNDYTKLKNWLEFPVSEFSLASGEETNVEFVINVPEDVPAGGQYAAIIIETSDSADSASSVRTINQVASLLYANVDGETRESGELVSQNIPQFLLGSPFTVSARVTNTGNTDFTYVQEMTIWDFFTGKEVVNPDAIDADGRNIAHSASAVLPNTTRYNALTWDGAPELGVFRVRQKINFLGQDQEFDRVVFICPIWLALAVVFIVLLFIFWLILRILTHRKNRSPRMY